MRVVCRCDPGKPLSQEASSPCVPVHALFCRQRSAAPPCSRHVASRLPSCLPCDGLMILFRRFAFSNFPPVGLCNFLLKLSPLVGGLISFISFLLSRGNSVFPLCWVLLVLSCRLWLLYSDSLPDSCFSYSCLRESRSLRRRYLTCRSFQLLWQYSQTAVHFGMVWEEFASFPRGWASAFPPFGRLPTAHA